MLYEGPFLHLLTEFFNLNLNIIENINKIKYYNIQLLMSCNPAYYVLTREDLEIKNYFLKLCNIHKKSKKHVLLINRKAPHIYYYSKDCKHKSGGSDRRTITNFDKLEIALKKIYKSKLITLYLEDISFIDQIDYFYNAELVIAQHGAALANMLWCDETTKCVEISQKKPFHCFTNLCYFKSIPYYNFDKLEKEIAPINVKNFISFLETHKLI